MISPVKLQGNFLKYNIMYCLQCLNLSDFLCYVFVTRNKCIYSNPKYFSNPFEPNILGDTLTRPRNTTHIRYTIRITCMELNSRWCFGRR